jgi:hypothetical protein
MHGKPKPALRALTVTYVVALLALAALAIASFFIPQREYRNQQTGDAVLRAASRQEALSERVSFLAYRVATARDPSERRRCRENGGAHMPGVFAKCTICGRRSCTLR